ncbi:MAG: hypothetical protein HY876_08700 [Coriobacteriales bacterium]|nr:hypothetical protein [Coriobacteriales bacterium]
MKRRVVQLAGLVAIIAVVAAAAWVFVAWDGVRSERELAPGDTLTLESGITLTVPPGWGGRQTRYYRVPLWLPIGQSRRDKLRFSEYVSLRADAVEDAADDFIAITFYDDSAAPAAGMVLANSDTARVYSGARGEPTHVETIVSGAARGHIFVRPASLEGQNARPRLAEVWDLLEIRGATLP